MAQGDVKKGLSSITTNAVLNIQPPAGEEWVIHNVYYNQGTVEFNITDGTNVLKFDTDTTPGGRFSAVFHVTNTQWLQIKNTATTSTLIGYDGVQTK